MRLVGYVFMTFMLLGIVEFGLFLLPSFVGERLFQGILYFPPSITREEYDRYLAIRDPLVGWPSPRARGHGDFDASGARISPAFPAPGNECVTLYGDSFTFGNEVGNAQAWGNKLAQKLGCRVGNFGVGGYGTDQALLRFKTNPDDSSQVAVLGIFADNLLRNVNQYRYFLSGSDAMGLKPRFVLQGGKLRLVAIPSLTYREMTAALRNPQTVWPHEMFLPGSPYGPISWSFPYTISFAHLLASPHVRNLLSRQPSWGDFYKTDHPSRALPTTVAIADEFDRIAKQRGKSVIVVLFPTPVGYQVFRSGGVSPFKPFTDALRMHHIMALDLSEDFSHYLKDRSFCELVTEINGCRGHFNPEGNELIASIVDRYIVSRNLLLRNR